MGRVKTKKIKGVSADIFAKYSDRLATNFEDNKKIVDTLAKIHSKKLRNVIAGYCTRLKKRQVKEQL